MARTRLPPTLWEAANAKVEHVKPHTGGRCDGAYGCGVAEEPVTKDKVPSYVLTVTAQAGKVESVRLHYRQS